MTIKALHVVQNTSWTVAPQAVQLKGFLKVSFRVIHFIHKIWCWFRKFNVYRKPNNFLKLAAGHSLNWVAGNQAVVKIAAQAVLIGARITDVIKEQTLLIKESRKLYKQLFVPHVLYPKIPIKEIKIKPCNHLSVYHPKKGKIGSVRLNVSRFMKSIRYHLLSPSTSHLYKVKIKNICLKIKICLKLIRLIVKRMFVLSMKMMDAASAFSYGEDVSRESINEFFINSTKCLKELTVNKELLLDSLRKNEKIITSLFTHSASLFTAGQLISAIEKSILFTEKVNQRVDFVSKKVGNIVTEVAQHAAFGLFQAAGMTEVMPNAWVPKIKTKEKKVNTERFLDIKLVNVRTFVK